MFTVESDAAIADVYGSGELSLEGGEGNDTFNLDLTIADNSGWTAYEGSGDARTDIAIRDFDPDEDRLVVSVDAAPGEEGTTYAPSLVEQGENEYRRILTLMEDDLAEGLENRTASVTIETTGPITLDDIVLVGEMARTA